MTKNRKKYISADSPKVFCCYCEQWLVYPRMHTKEHIIPVSHGGNNSKWNVKPSCYRCNTFKGAKTLQEFKDYIEKLLSENSRDAALLELIIKNIDLWIKYSKINKEKMLQQ